MHYFCAEIEFVQQGHVISLYNKYKEYKQYTVSYNLYDIKYIWGVSNPVAGFVSSLQKHKSIQDPILALCQSTLTTK